MIATAESIELEGLEELEEIGSTTILLSPSSSSRPSS